MSAHDHPAYGRGARCRCGAITLVLLDRTKVCVDCDLLACWPRFADSLYDGGTP
jgi:hypothetical protein